MILDSEGKAWLVDWADAGAYPPAFETAALGEQSAFKDFSAMLLDLLPRFPVEEK